MRVCAACDIKRIGAAEYCIRSAIDPAGYLIDMQMMAMFGSARERTQDEFALLLSEAGFTLQRTIPTQSPVWIVEAVPS